MDYDPPLRYLARVFLQNAGGTPGATAVGAVREALQIEDDLQLGVSQAIALDTGHIRQGIGLSSKNGVWTVSMNSESIDITFNMPLDGKVVSFPSFLQRASTAFVALMKPSGMKGSRIAAVSEGLLPEMPPEEMDAIAKRLLSFPPTFAPAPWEWDWRCVSSTDRTLGTVSEKLNTLAAAKRLSGQFNTGDTFDRIRLDLDINTHAANTTPRFSVTEIELFFAAYPSWYNELKSEISAFLLGEIK